jgi:hypothetical protein
MRPCGRWSASLRLICSGRSRRISRGGIRAQVWKKVCRARRTENERAAAAAAAARRLHPFLSLSLFFVFLFYVRKQQRPMSLTFVHWVPPRGRNAVISLSLAAALLVSALSDCRAAGRPRECNLLFSPPLLGQINLFTHTTHFLLTAAALVVISTNRSLLSPKSRFVHKSFPASRQTVRRAKYKLIFD